MDVLQNLNGGSLSLILVGLCALCLVGFVLIFGVHIIGAALEAVGHGLAIILHILSGGPTQWCGCLLAIGGCGVVALVIYVAATALAACGTNPTNFCALFGR